MHSANWEKIEKEYRTNVRNVRFRNPLRRVIYIINSINKTKLSFQISQSRSKNKIQVVKRNVRVLLAKLNKQKDNILYHCIFQDDSLYNCRVLHKSFVWSHTYSWKFDRWNHRHVPRTMGSYFGSDIHTSTHHEHSRSFRKCS